MVSASPVKGKCNYPLKFKCKKCGRIIKKNESKEKCEKCGGTPKPVEYCSNFAGKGTDHKGEGYCYHHDPRFESCSVEGRLRQAMPNLKHGHYSKYLKNMLLSVYKEEMVEVLQMVSEDPDTLLKILSAKATLLYSKTGDPRQAQVVLKILKEMVKTEKERREKGLVKEEEPVDLAELITGKYIEHREKERGQKSE